MLTVQDVKKIAGGRFYREGIQRFRDLIVILSLVWMFVWLVVYLMSVSFSEPSNFVQYSIPNSIVKSGEDIEITYTRNIGYSVNGYLLNDIREPDDSNVATTVLIYIIALLPVVGVFIWGGISEYRCNNYIDATVQKWVETKEI